MMASPMLIPNCKECIHYDNGNCEWNGIGLCDDDNFYLKFTAKTEEGE